jgi:hypothetical protein
LLRVDHAFIVKDMGHEMTQWTRTLAAITAASIASAGAWAQTDARPVVKVAMQQVSTSGTLTPLREQSNVGARSFPMIYAAQCRDISALKSDAPTAGFGQPVQQSQQRAFASARATDHTDHLPAWNLQLGRPQGLHCSVRLGQVRQCQHGERLCIVAWRI